MLPQVGQGALAVECRAGDPGTQARLAAVDDPAARGEVEAERAFLRRLGGGCNLPCGALARVGPDGTITIDVLLATLDGKSVLRIRQQGADPEAVGSAAARIVLEDLGGQALLDG